MNTDALTSAHQRLEEAADAITTTGPGLADVKKAMEAAPTASTTSSPALDEEGLTDWPEDEQAAGGEV